MIFFSKVSLQIIEKDPCSFEPFTLKCFGFFQPIIELNMDKPKSQVIFTQNMVIDHIKTTQHFGLKKPIIG